MAKYYFLYHQKIGSLVHQTEIIANTESEARKVLEMNKEINFLSVRKGREFKQAEIDKQRMRLRYS